MGEANTNDRCIEQAIAKYLSGAADRGGGRLMRNAVDRSTLHGRRRSTSAEDRGHASSRRRSRSPSVGSRWRLTYSEYDDEQ